MVLPMRSSLLSAVVLAAISVTFSSQMMVYRPASLEELGNPVLFSRQGSEPPKFDYGQRNTDMAGVKATADNGETNPDEPKMGTPINQDSKARLASLNSVDDWCTFGPMGSGKPLGDVEKTTVAYCTKPRNNARVIPDGTITAVHFVKTPLYVQVMARGDFTRIGMQQGDYGGELDPHGPKGKGNPVGGNVTSDVSGKDVFYQEWMNYIGFEHLCFRVCIAGSEKAPPEKMCEHKLDELGCNIIMPGDYHDDGFDTCDADVAYPPGVYVSQGQTTTFQQYFSTVVTNSEGKSVTQTAGSKGVTTPKSAYSTPASSNCKKHSSIQNNIKSIIPSSSSSAPPGGDKKGGAAGGKGGSGGANGEGKDGSKNGGSGGNGGSDNGSGGGNNGAAMAAPSYFSAAAVALAVCAGAFLL